MYYEFEIRSKLPSLNEYVEQCRRNPYAGNKFKIETEEVVGLYIAVARLQGYLPKGVIEAPLEVEIEWYERTKRRDCDNVLSGVKFVLDALQKYGVIKNDNRKCIPFVRNSGVYESEQDKIIIRLKEIISSGNDTKINNRCRNKSGKRNALDSVGE